MTDSNQHLPTRSQIDDRYKWRLEDIFASDSEWEGAFQALSEEAEKFRSYEGRLGESAEVLLEALRLIDDVDGRFLRVYAYAYMRQDEESTNPKYQSYRNRALSLSTRLQTAQSFFTPELLAVPQDRLDAFIANNEELALYRQAIHEIVRVRPHILSPAEESLLAQVGDISRAASNVFDMLNDADIRFPNVKDENGNEVELTHGRYLRLMKTHQRDVRKGAYEALYDTYGKMRNTLAALHNASVQKDVFYARVRKYDSALEKALDQDHIPEAVYDNLTSTIRRHLPELHRYMRLRKRRLGVDELRMYDLYAPIVPDVDIRVDYERAKELLLEGLQPLGPEYLGLLKESFEKSWIDVYESAGKTSGAYSFGVHGVHPFVLLNYQGTLDDAFTLAHEMGHALHSYLSSQRQPYVYHSYTIFLAEVASTVNEALLMEHLLQTTTDRAQRMYIINYYLDQFRTTVFRQTMFAEFERFTHASVEAGNPLTPEVLESEYGKLNEDYHGPDMVVDDRIRLEWARVPHFYRAFYVYKYATGFSAAAAISRQIIEEGRPAVQRYLEFLSAGSSDYSLNILKAAGVDMTTPAPIEAGMSIFSRLLDEMEELA